jgi:predicted nucleotidyltransferase
MPGYRSLAGHEQTAERLADALKGLCKQYHLVALYVFGSRAAEIAVHVRGEAAGPAQPDSDLDIGVLPARERRLPVEDRISLAMTLEDLFSVGRVDLVILPEADPFLAANIVRGERLYVQDESQADEYDLYVLRRAGDLAPLERERMALILGEQP